MTTTEAEVILRKAIDSLGEHFGAVQILASWCEGGETSFSRFGSGDWYARQGMCHAFIQQDKADEIGQSVARNMPPDNVGDEWKKNP